MNSQTVRLLIAEDDYLVNEEIKRSLKGLKYEIVGEAENGEQAITLIDDLKPDAVLMDIKMPIMDGLEASRLIQEQCPTPIVILTAHESEDLLERASKVGVGAYLTKPPNAAAIDRAITIAIARHHDLMEMRRLNQQLKVAENRLQNIFNSSIPICITNTDFQIILANDSYKNIFNQNKESQSSAKCYESRPGPSCQTDSCPMQRILRGEKKVTCETTKVYPDGCMKYFIITARPFLNNQGQLDGIVECFQDITDRKNTEMERDNLLEELIKALSEIKTLRGILPICSFCKNIRNDEGYYEQIEGYIHKHSGVDFSHTICPECAKKHYPDFYK